MLPAAGGANSPAVPVTPHSSKSNPFDKSRLVGGGPLADVLNRVLVHVEDLRPLITAADEVGFDVFAQILWPCVSTSIVDNLGNTIFAAGRPDELHKVSRNLQNSVRFMPLIESALYHHSPIHIALRSHGSISSFGDSYARNARIHLIRA